MSLSLNTCPTCSETTRQHKADTNHSGSQRFECQHCHRNYTPKPNRKGYELTRQQAALKLYGDGTNFRPSLTRSVPLRYTFRHHADGRI